MSETQRKPQDLARIEGDASDPLFIYITEPAKQGSDLSLIEGEPNLPEKVYATDPADTIGAGLQIGGPGSAGGLGHALGTVLTFAGTSAAAMYMLHLDGLYAAAVGLIAAVGGKVTLVFKDRSRNKR